MRDESGIQGERMAVVPVHRRAEVRRHLAGIPVATQGVRAGSVLQLDRSDYQALETKQRLGKPSGRDVEFGTQ